ncbi:diguanylate cyclase [Methylobacter sp.]|uniref:sensor domain-containing diguanylate cyclase n=1 Tax=Methylobacter sp. TaxID=2051955 RepID=UPI00248A24C4|nr:diguanylate cyclase [Methylobacter sp.]MDI1276921.1 diguanylate cyclase [Methylobacter sp.]MDI1359146.1 diguanylate cyclase [Methylobacter sp.]
MARLKHTKVIWIAATALVYYFLAHFGMALFALKPGNITLLWLPSGIALVMCLHWGYRSIPFIVLASFAANFSGMSASSGPGPFLHTAVAAIADGMVGIIAMHSFKYFLPNGLTRTHDLVPFGLWVCIVPTSITSIILSINLAVGGYISWAETENFFLMLVLADSLGILLVYQVYQGWHDDGKMSRAELNWLAGTTLVMAVLLTLGFTTLPGAVFFIVPLLLVLSFNVNLFGVATISSVSLMSIIVATAHNAGPFEVTDPADSNFRLMAFVFSSALTILGIALQNRQLTSIERSSELWKDAAEHDPLTGLINRRAFLPRLQNEHQRALRTGNTYTFAMLDLDHFKSINDAYGHHCGDAVLCALAAVMVENCRSIDAVVRMGGEEFGILFPECHIDEALIALERIRKRFESSSTMADGKLIFVTVSIGVAAFAGAEEKDTEVVERADRALYAAKAEGRNQIVVGL